MYERKQPIPSDEEIRARSYMIWEREGHPEGKSEEHWQRARAELAAEHTASMPFRKQPVLSEVNVRARAYMIWESTSTRHWLKDHPFAFAQVRPRPCARSSPPATT